MLSTNIQKTVQEDLETGLPPSETEGVEKTRRCAIH